MRVLVTGAAGFIGSRIAHRLLTAGAEVVALDAVTDYYDPAIKRRRTAALTRAGGSRCTVVEADLTRPGWEHHLDGVDAILHQAGQPGVRSSWSSGFEGYVHHNVLATQRLLEVVREHLDAGGRLQRLVYASSSSVYGDALTLPTPETALPAPRSPYGVTKLAAEHLCGTYARSFGLPIVALRYFTVYGGGQRPDMALHRIIAASRTGAPFPRFGDGEQRRDLTHVDDVAAANLAALDPQLPAGTVCNIAGGSQTTLNELLARVEAATGRSVPIEAHPEQAGDVRRTGADTSQAQRLLGWRPTVDLDAGIAEQIAYDG